MMPRVRGAVYDRAAAAVLVAFGLGIVFMAAIKDELPLIYIGTLALLSVSVLLMMVWFIASAVRPDL